MTKAWVLADKAWYEANRDVEIKARALMQATHYNTQNVHLIIEALDAIKICTLAYQKAVRAWQDIDRIRDSTAY